MSEPAFFSDADDLEDVAGDGDLAGTVEALIRKDLMDIDPGAVLRTFEAAPASGRLRFAFAWNDAMDRDDLGAWIAGDGGRLCRAEQIAQRIAPEDPSPAESEAALASVQGFTDWRSYKYALLIVPGYTPRDAEVAPGVNRVASLRLELSMERLSECLTVARSKLDGGLAPFVLVSGGNVHPIRTPYYEAIEMKKALCAMGVPEDRILVDARARHSTTNLRNAGRVLLANGLERALIVTVGGGMFGSDVFGQDFYFANPVLSTFHARCEADLGYRVGELTQDGEHAISFVPSPQVTRVNFRDALDP